MNSSSPARPLKGLTGTGTGRLGLVLALFVSFAGFVAIQTNVARAADPTAPAKAPLISGMPLLLTTDTTAEFTFGPGTGESQAITGYQCRVDTETFTDCTSPLTVTDLAVGDHYFGVKAKNEIGSGPEATFAWTVDPAPTESPVLGKPKVTPKAAIVKAGKKASFSVSVENTGVFDAIGTKVCASGPAALVSIAKKCQRVGLLEVDQIQTLTFSATVRKSAKKGKKAVLAFTATATDAEAQTKRVVVTVK